MKKFKVRFTIWLDDGVLDIAKSKAATEGLSVSEMLAKAATESLVRNRKDAEAEITWAVERVHQLLQKSDRKRGFESQVLKEMIGLAVLSFFNHTPAVAENQKKAALIDGMARFQKYMDTITANLMNAKSIVRQLPDPDLPAGKPAPPEPKQKVKPALKPVPTTKAIESKPVAPSKPDMPKSTIEKPSEKREVQKPSDIPKKPPEPNPPSSPTQSPPGTDQKSDENKTNSDNPPAAKKKWSLF